MIGWLLASSLTRRLPGLDTLKRVGCAFHSLQLNGEPNLKSEIFLLPQKRHLETSAIFVVLSVELHNA
jgi:hypothetical protein